MRKKGIELVAHSPLVRARQTSEGMLGCVTARSASNVECLWEGKKAASVDRVVELPCLGKSLNASRLFVIYLLQPSNYTM